MNYFNRAGQIKNQFLTNPTASHNLLTVPHNLLTEPHKRLTVNQATMCRKQLTAHPSRESPVQRLSIIRRL
jgi:hypothetical protein